jgi:hypothetical protein
VAKRLTVALINLVTDRSKKGLPAGGRGGLTKKMITILQSYYRNAIVKKRGNVAEMK